jgi:hypothetical protein
MISDFRSFQKCGLLTYVKFQISDFVNMVKKFPASMN